MSEFGCSFFLIIPGASPSRECHFPFLVHRLVCRDPQRQSSVCNLLCRRLPQTLPFFLLRLLLLPLARPAGLRRLPLPYLWDLIPILNDGDKFRPSVACYETFGLFLLTLSPGPPAPVSFPGPHPVSVSFEKGLRDGDPPTFLDGRLLFGFFLSQLFRHIRLSRRTT